jgi:CRP-like cAMP-binding protein
VPRSLVAPCRVRVRVSATSTPATRRRSLGSARWTIWLERIDERSDIATFLSHCTPFSNAKQSTIADLALRASERSYRQGDTIFDEGEVWPYLAFVRSGKVLYTLISPDGKTHTLGECLTHDPLNESGTFDGGGATTRAEALTDVMIASSRLRRCYTPSVTTANSRSAF